MEEDKDLVVGPVAPELICPCGATVPLSYSTPHFSLQWTGTCRCGQNWGVAELDEEEGGEQ